jgi:hypothetical protein
VVHLVDPAASFEVETPAAVVFVRGTTPRVEVDPDGTSHVRNVPDGMESRVGVRGKDAAQTEVILLPGEETDVVPGQPPARPRVSSPPLTPADPTIALPAVPTAPSSSGASSPACQQPGSGCNPFPTVDPCQARARYCGPSGPGATMPLPTATPRPNPCQRPGVVCDPQPSVDPCRLRASYCGPSGQEPAPPAPTRGLPPPVGDTGGSRPRPTLVVSQPPSGDTGGRTVSTLPQPPIGDLGSFRGPPLGMVASQPPQQPPSSGPALR